ncbi:MAG: hypothetical protein AAGF23_06975, partial [Acidobacteriota bacterium]
MSLLSVRSLFGSALLFLGFAFALAVQNHQGARASLPPERVPTLLSFVRVEVLIWGMWWAFLPWIRAGLAVLRPVRGVSLWRWLFALLAFGLVSGALWLTAMGAFQLYIWTPRPLEGPLIEVVLQAWNRSLALTLLTFASIVGVVEGLHLLREQRERAVRETQLRADLAEARLAGLQARLHPHFLFN